MRKWLRERAADATQAEAPEARKRSTVGFLAAGSAALLLLGAACSSSHGTRSTDSIATTTLDPSLPTLFTTTSSVPATTTTLPTPQTVIALCVASGTTSVEVLSTATAQPVYSFSDSDNEDSDTQVDSECGPYGFNGSLDEYASIGQSGSDGSPGCTVAPPPNQGGEPECAGYISSTGSYVNVWNAPSSAGSFSGDWTQVIDIGFQPGTNTLYWLTDQVNANSDTRLDLTLMSSSGTDQPITLPGGPTDDAGDTLPCSQINLAFTSDGKPLAQCSSNGLSNPDVTNPPGEQVVSQSSRNLPATANSVGTIVQEAGSESVAFISGSYIWTQAAPGDAPVQFAPTPSGANADSSYFGSVLYYGPDPEGTAA